MIIGQELLIPAFAGVVVVAGAATLLASLELGRLRSLQKERTDSEPAYSETVTPRASRVTAAERRLVQRIARAVEVIETPIAELMTGPIALPLALVDAAPARWQKKNTQGWRKPAGVVNVGPNTQWQNPYRVGDRIIVHSDRAVHAEVLATPEIALSLFRAWAEPLRDQIRQEMRGRDLMCSCPVTDKLGQEYPCHANVLIEFANA